MRRAWIDSGVCYIPLTRGYVALVDVQDAPLAERAWHASVNRSRTHAYAKNGGHPAKWLHHEVAARAGVVLEEGQTVDHVNGNTMDCRRANLRPATFVQQMQNRRKPSQNTSGYKGVSRVGSRWRARVSANGVAVDLGRYATKEEAAAVYLAAATRLHGEFARPYSGGC